MLLMGPQWLFQYGEIKKDVYLGGEIRHNLHDDKASKNDKLEESNIGIGYFTKTSDMSLYDRKGNLRKFCLIYYNIAF